MATISKQASVTLTPGSWVSACSMVPAVGSSYGLIFSAVLKGAKGAGRLELRVMRNNAELDAGRAILVAPFFPGIEREISMQSVVSVPSVDSTLEVQARWTSQLPQPVTLLDARLMLMA